MQQTVHIHTKDTASTNMTSRAADIASFYNIDGTAASIVSHGFRRLALQFPDTMLPDAVQVQLQLRAALSTHEHAIERMFVLGDTSYGSCCVDEVAAQHLFADCVVHFGRACLSPTSALPVIYVFGNVPCDVAAVAAGFGDVLAADADSATQHILLYEPCYQHVAAEITAALAATYPDRNFLCSTMRTFYQPGDEADGGAADSTFIGGMSIPLSPADAFHPSTSTLLYVGKESPHLTNILLRAGETVCLSFDPQTAAARREGASINRTLNRRYFLVQKAKEAQIVGILMGTLGVANCLDVVSTLQSLVAKSGRKAYTFVVGKINVPKLSNFAEIDVFCLVACAENTLLDSTDFFKPIVTPYELQLALTDDDSWSANYKADFQEVLPAMVTAVDEMDDDAPPRDEPYFSLVTGKYHQSKSQLEDDDDDNDVDDEASSTALVAKAGKQQLAAYKSEAAAFLKTRDYQGLDPRVGETAPHAAVPGATGIARGYTHE
ncbi:Aste57867_22189 [Aphanomyces stellatus]|uniref:2-(3-amino-3-carboxypropyl)histidine synthase subunit 2 n=1 Tax=Aphanomyces stellatus TaxID=120398 RepID=A0A485LJT0_9STRA|nr:hypothetical protein As57867_022120 [Aphanomyces stellatus]VFT98856.1 Aste57867_22189 [Aphanomyces stellatus]